MNMQATTIQSATVAVPAEAATAALVPVYTVPTATPAGMHALEYSRRSTEKNPIPSEHRYRVAFIPEGLRAIDAGAIPSKFATLVQASIDAIAKDRFENQCKEAEMRLAAIDPRAFSVDALLAYWAEDRERSRITKESMLAWLQSSATFTSLQSDAVRRIWLQRIPGILAPMYKNAFTVGEATQIAAKLADADIADPHCVLLANRLQIIIAGGGIEAEF